MSGPRLPDDGAGRGSSRDNPDTVGFAEKLLALLDSGARVTSYKFATLLALIDCCLEYAGGDGLAPTSITTHQLAEKVLELYWPQADTFVPGTAAAAPVVLSQSNTGRAEIITLIRQAREGMRGPRARTLARLRSGDPDGYAALVAAVEWKLVEMPLPRLQRFGGQLDEFIFHISWDERIRKRAMTQDFDNRILLRPGAGDGLLRLAPLLRPLIQREWTREVARWNRSVVEEARLEEFLFGTARVPTTILLPELRDIQDNTCFYCGKKAVSPEVDHFLPWARHPDNGLENLVLADRTCNNDKRDQLAAADHVRRWSKRFVTGSRPHADLDRVERELGWERHPERTLGAARAMYLRLPADVQLWAGRKEFATADLGVLRACLGDPGDPAG